MARIRQQLAEDASDLIYNVDEAGCLNRCYTARAYVPRLSQGVARGGIGYVEKIPRHSNALLQRYRIPPASNYEDWQGGQPHVFRWRTKQVPASLYFTALGLDGRPCFQKMVLRDVCAWPADADGQPRVSHP